MWKRLPHSSWWLKRSSAIMTVYLLLNWMALALNPLNWWFFHKVFVVYHIWLFFLFPNHCKLNLSSNNTMLELKALNIEISWFKSTHGILYQFLSPFYCQRSLLPSKGYKFRFSSFLLFALTFKLLAKIFLKDLAFLA